MHFKHAVAQMNCNDCWAMNKPPKNGKCVILHTPRLLWCFQLKCFGASVCIPSSQREGGADGPPTIPGWLQLEEPGAGQQSLLIPDPFSPHNFLGFLNLEERLGVVAVLVLLWWLVKN